MTIAITARNATGASLHEYAAVDVSDAVHYMAVQSAAAFVDGYTVGGFGIVRITARQRSRYHNVYSWLEGGDFRYGNGGELAAAISRKVGEVARA